MTTTIPSRREYEEWEAKMHAAQMREIEIAPLSDRQEARAEWLYAMVNHPDVIGERVSWLLMGTYGFGSQQVARRIVDESGRCNKVAALAHLIAALEWRCPAAFCIKAYRSLTKAQQRKVDSVIKAELKWFEKYRKENA